MSDKAAAAFVELCGRALYGEEWRIPLARALEISPRTIFRIAHAAALGRGFPVPDGVLDDCFRLLVDRHSEIAEAIVGLRGYRNNVVKLVHSDPLP